ncbi:MAG TPA: copper oxidase, partial [Vicinamibacteria bacterium]
MITRRRVLSGGALAAGGAALLERFTSVFTGTARAQAHDHSQHAPAGPVPPPPSATSSPGRRGGLPYTPVVTPDGATLPFVMKGRVKEFHLTAEPVRQEFAPGMTVNAWGYNGRTPGPTIEAVEGDRI